MVILLLINILFGQFVQKWYLDKGTGGPYGRILVCDTDRDSQVELIFGYGESLQNKTEIYELYSDSIFHLEAIIDTMTNEAWGVGDFDIDGFFDLVLTGDFGLPIVGPQIYESPDSFSYPTQEVWRDTVGQAVVTPISVCDIDRDGIPEIVKVGANGVDFVIYESIENNLYEIIYEDTIQGILTPTSTLAFGDFDGDSKIEFVLGNLSDGVGAAYWLYEAPADNTYDFIHLGSVPTKNIKDCFSVADADGDGKMEFVVKGFVIPSAEIHAFIFEATGDNTYEIIKTFTLPGGDYYGGYSEAGDVDGDSVPEIVLEARQNVFIIKAAGNDSFYVWDTLPGNTSGSSIAVYDIDENGLSEIIISGNNETRIYEYDAGGIEQTALRPLPNALRLLELSPNPFIQTLNIKFQTQTEKEVNIKVYDVTGRLVKNIYKGSIKGTNILKWNSKDENGRPVAQGIYFIRVENLDTGETLCKKVLRIE